MSEFPSHGSTQARTPALFVPGTIHELNGSDGHATFNPVIDEYFRHRFRFLYYRLPCNSTEAC